MQNLTLQMAQTTTLKKAMSVTNNTNAGVDHAAPSEPNTSFQALLNKQAKAQKDSARQELAQHKTAPKISNAQESDEGGRKSQLAVDYAEFVVAANDIKNTDGNASEHVEYAENLGAVAITQAVGSSAPSMVTNKTEMLAGDDDKKLLNHATDAGVIASTMLIPAPIVLTPATHPGISSTSENSGLPVASTTSQTITSAESAVPKSKASEAAQNETQDALLTINAKPVPEQTRWTDMMQPATKQIVDGESVVAKSMPDTAKEGNQDFAIKNVAIHANQRTLAQMNASLPAQAASANTINVYPGKAGWDQAISQKVVWMVGAGEQSATLTLNPPDLGPLQVVINVQNDKADTTFISDNAEVRQALQDGISNLREKMSESGIQLGQANVSSGGQAQQQFQQAMQNRGASSLPDNSVAASQTEKTTITNTLTRVSNGLVDTFA